MQRREDKKVILHMGGEGADIVSCRGPGHEMIKEGFT